MALLKALLKALNDWQDRRVAYWQLTNMSDKQLRDIGISRGEIKAVCGMA